MFPLPKCKLVISISKVMYFSLYPILGIKVEDKEHGMVLLAGKVEPL